MGADADASPVGGGLGVWPGIAILHDGTGKLVNHMGMTPPVASPLNEGEVIGVLNRLRELLDRLR